MKTKLLSLLMALMLCLSLAGCGASDSGTTSKPDEAETPTDQVESDTTNDSTNDTSDVDTESDDSSQPEQSELVSVTIPSGWYTQEEIERMIGNADSGRYESITVNEYESVTVMMTQEQHEPLVNALQTSVSESLAEAFPDENFPSIKSVECSDDCSEVTMTVDYDAYQASLDPLMEYVVILPCGLYQMFAGVEQDDVAISVTVIDEASGEVQYTAQYPDDYVTDDEAEEDTAVPQEANSMEGSGNLGDYYIEIKGASLSTDYEGNDAIVITLSWTNNSEETTNFGSIFLCQAFQDGIEMETTFVGNDLEENIYKDIRPGATLEVNLSYLLSSQSVVEFEVSDWIWNADVLVSMDFDPATL